MNCVKLPQLLLSQVHGQLSLWIQYSSRERKVAKPSLKKWDLLFSLLCILSYPLYELSWLVFSLWKKRKKLSKERKSSFSKILQVILTHLRAGEGPYYFTRLMGWDIIAAGCKQLAYFPDIQASSVWKYNLFQLLWLNIHEGGPEELVPKTTGQDNLVSVFPDRMSQLGHKITAI